VLATVLICGDASHGGEQRVGMVVRQVLDVSTGTLLERDPISDAAGMELALVKEKLTLVQRRFGTKATTAWQEVA
jgi:two-component system chemotaxis sensor kinase CheA